MWIKYWNEAILFNVDNFRKSFAIVNVVVDSKDYKAEVIP